MKSFQISILRANYFILTCIVSYLYKVVISVCLFVCPIITQEPLDKFRLKF